MPGTVTQTSYQQWSVSVWELDLGDDGFADFADDPAAALRDAIANTPGAPAINGIIIDPAFAAGAGILGKPITYHVDRPPERESYWFIFGPPAVVER